MEDDTLLSTGFSKVLPNLVYVVVLQTRCSCCCANGCALSSSIWYVSNTHQWIFMIKTDNFTHSAKTLICKFSSCRTWFIYLKLSAPCSIRYITLWTNNLLWYLSKWLLNSSLHACYFRRYILVHFISNMLSA